MTKKSFSINYVNASENSIFRLKRMKNATLVMVWLFLAKKYYFRDPLELHKIFVRLTEFF